MLKLGGKRLSYDFFDKDSHNQIILLYIIDLEETKALSEEIKNHYLSPNPE